MNGRDTARRLRAVALATVVTLSVLAVLIGGVGGAAAAGNNAISSCTVIDQPGTYELTANVTDIDGDQLTGGGDTPAACIDIRSSDVVIDGGGHELDWGAGIGITSDQTAVFVNGTADTRRNVSVEDVTLTDWPRGVSARDASDVVVEDVSAHLGEGTTNNRIPGIEFRTVSNSTVRNSYLGNPYRINNRGVNPDNRYSDNVVDREIVIRSPNATVVNNSVGGAGPIGQISVLAENATVSNNTIEEGYVEIDGRGPHIENNTIDNHPADLTFALTISGEGASIRNNTVTDSFRGMQISGSDHVLRDNEIRDNEQNFHVGDLGNDQPPGAMDVDTSNTVDGEPIYYLHGVTDQTFSEADAGYLAIVDSSGITVNDVVLTNNTEGLLLANVSDVTIENATLEGNKYGLEAWEGEDVTIRESRLSGNAPIPVASGEIGAGFVSRSSGTYSLESNDVSDNSVVGLEVRSPGVVTTVRNNNITANGDYGIRLGEQADAMVDGNDISNNGEGGIFATTPNATFVNNTITGHDDVGKAGLWIGREGTTPRGGIDGTNRIENNTVRDNYVGIRLWWNHPTFPGNRDELAIDDNVIVDNVVTGNTFGISLREWAENNTIRNNHATGNDHGIFLSSVGNNRVLDNNASNNVQDGIRLSGYDGGKEMEAGAFVVRNNTAISNGDDGIELDGARDSNDPSGPFYVDGNAARLNGGNGIVVNDAENVTVADNGRVSENGGAGIWIEASSNVSVTNHTTTENGLGIFAGASALSIEDLNASANHGDGIVLNDADGLDLRSDVTANDNDDDGLVLVDTSDASVEDITTNDNSATGIEITADAIQAPENVTLRNVTALRNGFGVRIVDTDEVTVSESTVGESPDADGVGIVVHGARNASVIDTSIEDNDGQGIVVMSTSQLLDSSSGAEIVGATVRNNGDDGIEYREFSGGSTIADTTIVDNGPNGVRLEDSSNVTVRNATIEGHSENGVEIVGDSDDNTIEQSDIRSHTNGNASGHGVFVHGISTEGAYASGTTIEENTIADNDLGVTVFDDSGNAIRGNDILRNTKGVRIGSSGFQTLQENSVDCDGDPDTREGSTNLFGGTSEGAVVDNHIESDDIALEMVTYPWRTEICDGTTVETDYSNPTIEDYRIVNNHIEAPTLINDSTHHGAQFDGSNTWNASKIAEGNVLGGPYRAGNFWAKPDGSGLGQTCDDTDGDGICDSGHTVSTNNVDELPLAANQPTAFVISIDSTNSPVTEGETLSVSATVENTGEAQISQTVALSIGGIEHDSTSVTLDSGESTTVSLNWTTTAGDAGDYTATVASEISTASTSVTVESDGETSSPANFEVSIDSTNSPVLAGTDFEVTATIENTGDLADTQAVNLSVPGEIENTTDVSLEGGESTSVTLSLSTESLDNKTYSASIATDNMSVDTELEVVEPDAAFYSTTILETNSPVPNGSDVVVTANVENTGDLPATKEVRLTIHGETAIADENTTDVSLDGGESTNVTLSVSTDSLDAGNYTSFMGVSSDGSDSTQVEIEAEQIDPTVELTAIDASGSASTPPTGQIVHTNGTVSFEVAANGTPGDAASVTVTLEATFANFEHVVAATHQGGDVWTATADLTSLPDDGTYAVNVSAIDAAGNENETTAAATVDLDRVAPELGATASRFDENGSVNVTASEELAGPPTIEVEKPNGTTETPTVVDTGDGYWNATFDLIDDGGQYDVTVTGTDHAGNRGTGDVSTFIDTVETENNTATVVLEPSRLFVNFTTDTQVSSTVVVTESNTPLAPLAADQAGVNFLNAQLGDVLEGNLSHAVIGIPVDMTAVPQGVDREDVDIRYYDETSGAWQTKTTAVETHTIAGTTQEYWIANVTQFSTYGAVATDDVAPTLDAATPSGQLSAGTTSHTVRFEYTDAISGVDVGAVQLVFDGNDVTGDAATSITSQYAAYDASGLGAGSYTASVTVPDVAGNEETYETTFTVPSADDNDGGSGDPGGSESGGSSPAGGAPPDRFSRIIADQDPDESGVQVRFDDGPVEALSFEDESLEGAGEVSVTQRETSPTTVADEFGSSNVVTSVDIEVPEASEDASATIRFRLSLSEVGDRDQDSLRVVRVVDGENHRLPTEVEEDPNGGYVVEADTPGFSTFAVVSVEEQVESPTETATTDETMTATSETTPTTEEPTSTATEPPTRTETPSGLDGFGALAALVAIVVASLYAHRRRR